MSAQTVTTPHVVTRGAQRVATGMFGFLVANKQWAPVLTVLCGVGTIIFAVVTAVNYNSTYTVYHVAWNHSEFISALFTGMIATWQFIAPMILLLGVMKGAGWGWDVLITASWLYVLEEDYKTAVIYLKMDAGLAPDLMAFSVGPENYFIAVAFLFSEIFFWAALIGFVYMLYTSMSWPLPGWLGGEQKHAASTTPTPPAPKKDGEKAPAVPDGDKRIGDEHAPKADAEKAPATKKDGGTPAKDDEFVEVTATTVAAALKAGRFSKNQLAKMAGAIKGRPIEVNAGKILNAVEELFESDADWADIAKILAEIAQAAKPAKAPA